jgi:hypothetical protein
MIEKQEKQKAPYSEAREFINNKLKAEHEQKTIQAFVEQAIKDSGVEISGEKSTAAQEANDKNQAAGTTGDVKK